MVFGEHVLYPLELWQNCSDVDVRNCVLHFGVLDYPFSCAHTHTIKVFLLELKKINISGIDLVLGLVFMILFFMY